MRARQTDDYELRVCITCKKEWKYYRRYRDGKQMVKAEGNPNVRQRCDDCIAEIKNKRRQNGRRSVT